MTPSRYKKNLDCLKVYNCKILKTLNKSIRTHKTYRDTRNTETHKIWKINIINLPCKYVNFDYNNKFDYHINDLAEVIDQELFLRSALCLIRVNFCQNQKWT